MPVIQKITKFTTYTCAAALALWGVKYAIAPAYEGRVGIGKSEAFAPIRNATLDFHICYPAQAGGRSVTVGGNGVFYGTVAGRGAPHRQGQFPMVLIPHGAGGNADQFGWIAAALADAAVRVWERPADITAVIDHIVAQPQDYPYIDTNRIAALGFSVGGYTAMAVLGARVDTAALQGFCNRCDHGMSDCAFLARGGVDLHALDLSSAAQDLPDARIKAAVVIDPGIGETFMLSSLSKVDIPMMIVNLGDAGTIPAVVDASEAAKLILKAQYRRLDDATHFSFLAQCKPKRDKILKNEGEADLLCDDAGGRGRGAIHTELKDFIVAYLSAQF